MSDAKKCDRCGSYFTLDKVSMNKCACKITTYRQVDQAYDYDHEETRLPVDNNSYGPKEYIYGDLCILCTEELRNWWKSWKDRVKDG